MPPATCLGCGCACDDIDVRVDGSRIVEARHACELGMAWFGDGSAPSRAAIDGRDVERDAALDAAASLLAGAGRPLVYLAPDLSCEAQREAVALADCLGAALDSVTSDAALGSILAAQERGRAGATLGEVRHRADLLVCWGVDPAVNYPRYLTRYALAPGALFIPDGRPKTMVAVDIGDAAGPAAADIRITIAPEAELAALTALRAMVGGAAVDASEPLRELAACLRRARYTVVIADEERLGADVTALAAGLIALAQELNGPARGALSLLRGGGNRSGADAVMTAHTGYPAAVDFVRGYPRYRPYDGTAAARLARREVDAVAIVGAAARIPANFAGLMAGVPAAVIGPGASATAFAGAGVVVDTAAAGIHEDGVVLRMDDVPLPLRRVVAGPPATSATLRALVDRLTKTDPAGASARRIGLARVERTP